MHYYVASSTITESGDQLVTSEVRGMVQNDFQSINEATKMGHVGHVGHVCY